MTSKTIFYTFLIITGIIILGGICCWAHFYYHRSMDSSLMHGQGKEITLAVPDMYCASCPITIQKVLKDSKGVMSAKADFKTKSVIVRYDPHETSIQNMTETFKSIGYSSILLKEEH